MKKREDTFEIDETGRLIYSRMAGGLFERAVNKRNYDLNDFAYKVMTTPQGRWFMNWDWIRRFDCEGYVLECLEEELIFKPKFREYQSDPWYVGNLYMRYILELQMDAYDVWKLLPFNVLDALYQRLHINGFSYCVDEVNDWKKGRYGSILVDFHSEDGWDESMLRKSEIYVD